MSYYLFRFYLDGRLVGSEALKCRDAGHAARLGSYVARAFVRAAVAASFDERQVGFAVAPLGPRDLPPQACAATAVS